MGEVGGAEAAGALAAGAEAGTVGAEGAAPALFEKTYRAEAPMRTSVISVFFIVCL